MRVGVDGSSWDDARGYGRFARNVVEHLVALDPSAAYVMPAPPSGGPALPLGSAALGLGGQLGAPRPADRARPPHELLRLARLARRAHLDVLLFPSITWFRSPGVPSIVGIHDAIAATLPELTPPTRRARLLWSVKERWAVRSSARVFTVSAAAQAVVVERWKLPRERVAIVPEAPAAVFTPVESGVALPHLEAIGLEVGKPFLVFAGGISPPKGLDVLLAVEAPACGAPLVLSDLPAPRETRDGAALFTRPGDTAALAEAVARMVEDVEMRAALSAGGADAVAGLSWEAGARVLRDLLVDVVAHP